MKKEKAKRRKRQKGRKPSRKARGEFQRQAEKPKPQCTKGGGRPGKIIRHIK